MKEVIRKLWKNIIFAKIFQKLYLGIDKCDDCGSRKQMVTSFAFVDGTAFPTTVRYTLLLTLNNFSKTKAAFVF